MLPAGFLQDLLSRVDIVEIVGRHVALKKAGINHKGLCPFHGEKTPSFIVSPSRQTYHCFGCGAHGDAIRFLTEHSGMGFMDAVRELAQQVGLTVPDDRSTPEDRARAAAEKARQATLTDVLAKAADHYRAALKASPRAVAYLKRRGLTGQVAARFGLGYAPEGWRGLASVFPRYDDPLLAESGLVIVQGEDEDPANQKRYDRFRDRIMFPIRSVKGEVIGFGGRVLDQGEPKYLNSPETPVFHKGHELYGLYEARQALRQAGHVLVVEGYMDVVALAQWGFGNAVATLGTACTADHVAKLFRFTDAVVFSFDGDAAGRRAAARALEAALPHATDTRSIRFLFLPAEHDPDSYVRELGAEAFAQAVAQAVPLSAQLLVQAAADCDLDTAEGRARMLAQARPLVEALPEGLLRSQILAELAQRGGLTAEALTAHWNRQPGGRGRGGPAPAGAGDGPPGDEPPWGDAPPDDAGAPDRGSWRGEARDARDGGRGAGGWRDGRPRRDGGSGWRDGGSWRPGSDRWRGDRRGGFRPEADLAPRRPPPQTATLLDRTAWLLARHSGLCLALDGAQHEFLHRQGPPYGAFFAALERVVHDQGPIAMAALLDEIAREPTDDATAALLGRLRQFHEVADDDPPDELLAAALHRLRQRAVDEEIEWLLESGDLSEDAVRRRNELFALRAALKTSPPPVTTKPS